MISLASRTVPNAFDVILVVTFDREESLGIDIRSDLRNFTAQGLKVALVSLSQTSGPNRYRNGPLVKTAFDLDVPILGPKDVSKTQLAIVYNPELIVARQVRGRFLAQQLWLITEDGTFEPTLEEDVIASVREFCVNEPVRMAVNVSVQQVLSAQVNTEIGLWNYHAGFEAVAETNGIDISWTKNNYVGLPSGPFSPEALSEVRVAAGHTASAGLRLCAMTDVPKKLQTGKGEPDHLVGFPFVPTDRDEFLKTLFIYVVPRAMLAGTTWRADVYRCMSLGIPVAMPRVLEPYFGNAAKYYDADITELLPFVEQQMELQSGADAGRELCLSRGYGKTVDVLAAFGLFALEQSPGTGEPARVDDTERVPLSTVPVRHPRVCFVTSNGAGMGHLTRLLAVARRLDPGIDVSFVSMSQACGVVADYGYGFEYVPSKGDMLVDGPSWNQYFNKRFLESLNRLEPDVVVFDGTWPYQGIAQAVATYDAKFVWMRRGMWRAETVDTALVRNTGFDTVIEPGDLAASYDAGPTKRAKDAHMVAPIIVLDPSEIQDRSQAREALGIEPGQRAMLLTLGAGNINKIDDDVKDVLSAVRSLPDRWRIFMTSPLIAESRDVAEGVENISIYPLANYAHAFDFVVSATGYNSFHEWIAYGVPALWIANANTITDDQVGRARFAHDAGLGFAAGPGGSISIADAVQLLGQTEVRTKIRAAMQDSAFQNGAGEAARHISQMAAARCLP